MYFTRINEEAKTQDDIYMSYFESGTYTVPIPLGKGVNTEKQEYNAFISPDESYLIFGSWQRDDQVGGGDLYISFKSQDGTWQNAKNLGTAINSTGIDYCPFVNTTTSSLYFTSRRSAIETKPSGFSSYNELVKELDKYEIGFSRIFKVDIGALLTD